MTRRVLHLIPTLQGGGAEYQLSLLAAHLPASGWEVSVGYVREGVHLAALNCTSARLHRLSARGSYDPALLWSVVRLVRRERPALVQTWLPQMDVVGGVAARMLGIPWIVSERSSQPVVGRHVVGALRERLVHGATAVISNSTHALLHWERVHPGVRRVHLPNAIPIAAADAAPPSEGVQAFRATEPCLIAVGVGRLISMKRFDVFLEAMQIVSARTAVRVVICGEGPLRHSLEESATALGLIDRVTFTGFVSDVFPYVKAADVLVALSEYEGRPNAVVEAMAARTPLVVSDIPEHRELLGSDALFVRGSDPQDVASAIFSVIADRGDAVARAASARRRAAEWDAPVIAAQHAAVYDDLTRSASGGKR